MKHDIVLAGVGGQGILTIAAIIGEAAVRQGLHVKQSEVHGMAQRGGAVLAHLRLSSEPIHSDLIAAGSADVVLAVEPMEALRQAESLSPSGVILANARPVRNIGDYRLTTFGSVTAFPLQVVLTPSRWRRTRQMRAPLKWSAGACALLEFPRRRWRRPSATPLRARARVTPQLKAFCRRSRGRSGIQTLSIR